MGYIGDVIGSIKFKLGITILINCSLIGMMATLLSFIRHFKEGTTEYGYIAINLIWCTIMSYIAVRYVIDVNTYFSKIDENDQTEKQE